MPLTSIKTKVNLVLCQEGSFLAGIKDPRRETAATSSVLILSVFQPKQGWIPIGKCRLTETIN